MDRDTVMGKAKVIRTDLEQAMSSITAFGAKFNQIWIAAKNQVFCAKQYGMIAPSTS